MTVALEARAELARRELQRRAEAKRADVGRESLLGFCEWTDPEYDPTLAHAKIICEYLDALVRRDIENLAICMPPQHGKSYHFSQRMPGYALGVSNGKSLIATTSYTIDVARKNSRAIRGLLRNPRYPFPNVSVDRVASGVDEWYTNHGGGVKAAGVGGSLTGFGAHIIGVDDPFKDRAEADSLARREIVWNWWTDVVSTRQRAGAQKMIAQTRWNEDDLIGRLQNTLASKNWTFLNLRSSAEEDDPLGRPLGAILWEGGPKPLNPALGEISTRSYAALYQQRPAPIEGSLFKRPWFNKRYRTLPSDIKRGILYVDGAWKDGVGNDRSAFAAWVTNGIDYFLVDAFAARMEYPDLKVKAASLWTRHRGLAPTMRFGVEDAASGIPLIQEFKRSTSIPIIGVAVDKSKYVRAEAVTPEFESGRVYIPEDAPWFDEWMEEHVGFPTGSKHDDYVDTSSGALAQLKGSNNSLSWGSISTARSK